LSAPKSAINPIFKVVSSFSFLSAVGMLMPSLIAIPTITEVVLETLAFDTCLTTFRSSRCDRQWRTPASLADVVLDAGR
jgi:hypothetical protein